MALLRSASAFSFIFLFSLFLHAQPAAWIVVNGQGPDDNNRRPGIQNQGIIMNIGGTPVYDPPDDCVNPSKPTYKQFRTLQSALYALAQGFLSDRKIVIATNGPILGDDPTVPPGVNRAIIVRNPVEIIAGPSTNPVIKGGVNVVTINASGVSLEGLEITGGSGSGVYVNLTSSMTTSQLVNLVDVYIHGNRASGVYVVGGRTNLTIMRRNWPRVRIEDHRSYGVCMDSRGLCSITDTDIRRSALDGVRLDNAALLMEHTVIDNNSYRGLFMRNTQQVTVRRCRISNNVEGGAYIDSTGQNIARFTGNIFTGNHRHAVFLKRGGIHFLEDTIQNTKGNGLYAERSTPVTFEDCVLDSNDSTGIRVIDSSWVDLKQTKVGRSGTYGIAAERSRVTMTRSEVFLSRRLGVYLVGGDLSMKDSCIVDTSGGRGVELIMKATGLIEKSTIKRNGGGGVYVHNCPGRLEIRNNKILNNRTTSQGGGILIWQNSRPQIAGNEIRGNEADGIGGGISIFEAAATIGSAAPGDGNTIVENETKNGIGGGIAVSNASADIGIEHNNISRNRATSSNPLTGRGGGVAVHNTRNTTIRFMANTVDSNRVTSMGGGFYALEVRQCKFNIGEVGGNANYFRWNAADSTDSLGADHAMRIGGGLLFTNSDSIFVTGNHIYGNLGTGIHIDAGGKHTIAQNRIGWDPSNNPAPDSGHGISIVGSNDNLIGTGNKIGNNAGSGVSVGRNGRRNRIAKNSITANSLRGIHLWRGGNTMIDAPVFDEISAARVSGWAPAMAGSSVEVYEDPDGEGETYKGNIALAADSTFIFAGPFVNNGLNATATVTTPDGNTSEFGNAILDIVLDNPVNRVIDMADPRAEFLEIGHWGEDAGAGLTGYDGAGRVMNAAATAANAWENFIDRDPDRFYIRIRDSRSNKSATDRDTVSVTIETRDSLDAVDDAATELQLIETGVNTSIFASQAQLLMSPDLPLADRPDDAFPAHDGTAGIANDNARNDRTHRASINDSVAVSYRSSAGVTACRKKVPVIRRAPADNRRIAYVKIHVFNEPYINLNGNGVYNPGEPFLDLSSGAVAYGLAGIRGPVVTAADVAAQMRRANIAWAQAGIEFRQAGPIIFQDAPKTLVAGVPTDIFQDGDFDLGAADEDSIVATFARSAMFDTIEVFFIAPFAGGAANAISRTPSDLVAGMGELTFIYLIPNLDVRLRTLAHEFGHALDNWWDAPNPPSVFYPANSTYRDNDVEHYRRVTHATETNVRLVRPPGAVGAMGNRILKQP